MTVLRELVLVTAILLLGACRDPTGSRDGFLGGNGESRDIGLVLDSAGQALILFQVGNPEVTRPFALPAPPTDFDVLEDSAAVALGDAGTVMLIDLDSDDPDRRPDRSAAFPGRLSAVAFVGPNRILAANETSSSVGLIEFDETGGSLRQSVPVPRGPRRILEALGRAYVLSDNGAGQGVITILDTRTLEVIGTVPTGGADPQDMAWGSADRLFVVNAGTGPADGSLGVVSAITPELLEVVRGMGTRPSRIFVDTRGRAYLSSRVTGTVIWDTERNEFFAGHGPANPLCPSPCPGAVDAAPDGDRNALQALAEPRAGQVQVWRNEGDSYDDAGVFTLGVGPTALQIRRF